MTRVWDPIRGRLLTTLSGQIRGQVGTRSQIAIGRRDDLILYQVGAGAERRTIDCRTLRERTDSEVYGPEGVAFSPDGSMIALALRPDGVRIVRASDGMGLAHLPIGRCNEVQFMADGSLLTNNALGLCRWPSWSSRDGIRRLGPPEPLAPNISRHPALPIGLQRERSTRRRLRRFAGGISAAGPGTAVAANLAQAASGSVRRGDQPGRQVGGHGRRGRWPRPRASEAMGHRLRAVRRRRSRASPAWPSAPTANGSGWTTGHAIDSTGPPPGSPSPAWATRPRSRRLRD